LHRFRSPKLVKPTLAGCEADHSLLSEYVKNSTIVKQFSKNALVRRIQALIPGDSDMPGNKSAPGSYTKQTI
jgi:hypothetical protein